MDNAAIERAKAQFGKLSKTRCAVSKGTGSSDWIDYSKVETLRIGILAGDGIGPFIAGEARRILELLLADEVRSGKIVINDIEGLTIENRSAHGKTIPDDVLEEIRKYHVTLKGPTYTPRVGDPWPNLESCNVAMRKELDLFANLRPVRIPTQGIDWAFFRENTEDLYALGPYGLEVDDNITVDFRLISNPGLSGSHGWHSSMPGRTTVLRSPA